jgi:hypothetical protein
MNQLKASRGTSAVAGCAGAAHDRASASGLTPLARSALSSSFGVPQELKGDASRNDDVASAFGGGEHSGDLRVKPDSTACWGIERNAHARREADRKARFREGALA